MPPTGIAVVSRSRLIHPRLRTHHRRSSRTHAPVLPVGRRHVDRRRPADPARRLGGAEACRTGRGTSGGAATLPTSFLDTTRLHRPDQSDVGRLLAGWKGIRRGEGRDDQGLRVADCDRADDLRGPADAGLQLLGSRPPGPRPRPRFPGPTVRLRAVHLRPCPRRRGGGSAMGIGGRDRGWLPDHARLDDGRLRGQRAPVPPHRFGQFDDGGEGPRRRVVPAVPEPLRGDRDVRRTTGPSMRAPETARASTPSTTASLAARSAARRRRSTRAAIPRPAWAEPRPRRRRRVGPLRSQSVRGTTPVLNGSIIRVDPDTGDALPDNPNGASADPAISRILAYGLRNPFRFTTRPGTNELWIGDVGWSTWEEINVASTTGPVRNFGWPCYEGSAAQAGYQSAGLSLCTSLYSAGTATSPFFAYQHSAHVATSDGCPTGSSAITGLAFYPTSGGAFPCLLQGRAVPHGSLAKLHLGHDRRGRRNPGPVNGHGVRGRSRQSRPAHHRAGREPLVHGPRGWNCSSDLVHRRQPAAGGGAQGHARHRERHRSTCSSTGRVRSIPTAGP